MADRHYRSSGEEPAKRTQPHAATSQQRRVAERLMGAPTTPISSAALERWIREVSVPLLASPFLVFTQCLAYAAPVWARLKRRPVAWCFHGPQSSGRNVLPDLSACVYGDYRDLQTWQALGSDLPVALAAQEDGLVAISEPAPANVLGQTTVAARMWHDHEREPALADRRDAITVFDSDLPFSAHLARARFGDGKLWVFNIPADAGTGHGIYLEQPAEASAAGAAAVLLMRAYKAPSEAGVRWLRFVNWWPDDQLAALFVDHPTASDSEAYVDDRTRLTTTDVRQCFDFVSTAGEWATEQGLTGWPRGAAFEASQRVLAAWGSSATGG